MSLMGSSPRWPYTYAERRKMGRSFMPYTQWATWGAFDEPPPEKVRFAVWRELEPYHCRIGGQDGYWVMLDEDMYLGSCPTFQQAAKYFFDKYGKPNHYAEKPNPEG